MVPTQTICHRTLTAIHRLQHFSRINESSVYYAFFFSLASFTSFIMLIFFVFFCFYLLLLPLLFSLLFLILTEFRSAVRWIHGNTAYKTEENRTARFSARRFWGRRSPMPRGAKEGVVVLFFSNAAITAPQREREEQISAVFNASRSGAGQKQSGGEIQRKQTDNLVGRWEKDGIVVRRLRRQKGTGSCCVQKTCPPCPHPSPLTPPPLCGCCRLSWAPCTVQENLAACSCRI